MNPSITPQIVAWIIVIVISAPLLIVWVNYYIGGMRHTRSSFKESGYKWTDKNALDNAMGLGENNIVFMTTNIFGVIFIVVATCGYFIGWLIQLFQGRWWF